MDEDAIERLINVTTLFLANHPHNVEFLKKKFPRVGQMRMGNAQIWWKSCHSPSFLPCSPAASYLCNMTEQQWRAPCSRSCCKTADAVRFSKICRFLLFCIQKFSTLRTTERSQRCWTICHHHWVRHKDESRGQDRASELHGFQDSSKFVLKHSADLW